MKIIKNRADAICMGCFAHDSAVVVAGRVVCWECGQRDFIDNGGDIFQPLFGDDPGATYRASRYTPALPDRRVNHRRMPLVKERPQGLFV